MNWIVTLLIFSQACKSVIAQEIPEAPSSVSTLSIDADGAYVKFEDSFGGEMLQYTVYFQIENLESSLSSQSVMDGSMGTHLTNLISETHYLVWVTATNEEGESAPSPIERFKVGSGGACPTSTSALAPLHIYNSEGNTGAEQLSVVAAYNPNYPDIHSLVFQFGTDDTCNPCTVTVASGVGQDQDGNKCAEIFESSCPGSWQFARLDLKMNSKGPCGFTSETEVGEGLSESDEIAYSVDFVTEIKYSVHSVFGNTDQLQRGEKFAQTLKVRYPAYLTTNLEENAEPLTPDHED